ncbi:MAG: hypothetical protein J1F71_03485 [Clostridiales bacterium]|nr:hypothetical protein [Clostridiales bacterium]
MNAVVFYSATDECKRIAAYFAERLSYEIVDIVGAGCKYERAALVFPVHCQNIPQAVIHFLKRLTVDYLTVIAVYGKMCHGNVLYEIQRKFRHNIIAAAYVPAKHTYIDEPRFSDFDRLDPVIDKATKQGTVIIPKSYKNPFANVFKGLRSRMGVKIIKNNGCDNCGMCQYNCPRNAIVNGKTNRNCIRCLRCVASCPKKALSFKTTPAMSAYLKKKKQDELIIYI